MSETVVETTTEHSTETVEEQQPAPPTFSQADVDRIVADRLKRQKEQIGDVKALKAAADELASIKEGQKTEAQRTQDRIAAAEAEVASVPAKVTESLKAHLIGLHSINDEDAELFLTATNPDLLLKQVARLTARDAVPAKKPNHVPREGANPTAPENEGRETVRRLFGDH